MFSHIAGNEAKHKSVFHGTEPHPVCWTSVSGMQSETARDMLRNSSGVHPSSRVRRRLCGSRATNIIAMPLRFTHPMPVLWDM